MSSSSAADPVDTFLRGTDRVLVFGYGSLVWRPSFAHVSRRCVFVRGWHRRFWQGSPDHRGTPARPGLVVTMVEAGGRARTDHGAGDNADDDEDDESTRTWGVAFEVAAADRDAVLAYLDEREKAGFERTLVDTWCVDDGRDNGGADDKQCDDAVSVRSAETPERRRSSAGTVSRVRPYGRALMYMATRENEHFVGDIGIDRMAETIASAQGTYIAFIAHRVNLFHSKPGLEIKRPCVICYSRFAAPLFAGESGRNCDYLFNLATALRDDLRVCDAHVFALEAKVREKLGDEAAAISTAAVAAAAANAGSDAANAGPATNSGGVK
jgi:cation transport regulator ChaC